MASRLQDVILRGPVSTRPLATAVAPGTLFYSTDVQTTERSNGLIWETYSDAGGSGGGGGITQLTGDVTAGPGVGTQVTTLAHTAVSPGSYTNTNLTVDAKGRITAAANGSSGGGVSAHHATHEPGGTDAMAVDATSTTGSLRTLGTGPNQATAGNDSRLTDSRTPTSHATSHSSGGSDAVDVKNLDGYPGGSTQFLRADATFATPPDVDTGINQLNGDVTAGPGNGNQTATLANTAVTPGPYTNANITVDSKGRITAAANGSAGGGAHATTHSSGGSDPVTVTNLAGYPGGTTNFLRADGTFNAPPVPSRTVALGMIIDGGGAVITTGVKGYIEVPFACTITGATLLADVSGSIVVDVFKDTYANYPPVVGDKITASAPPTITGAVKSKDTTLTGWTTAVAAGDILAFNVNSVTTIQRVTVSLTVSIP